MAVEQPHDPSAGGSNCPDAGDLAAYLEGTLNPAARGAVEEHLADCAWCREAVADALEFLEEPEVLKDEDVRLAVAPGPPGAGVTVPSGGADEPSRVVQFPSRDTPEPLPPVVRFPWQAAAVALGVAAALLLVARLAPQWLPWGGRSGERPELQELIAALAKEPTRPVEGRLTGGFNYAPPPSVMRGGQSGEVSPEVRIAAANIQKRAADDARGREAEGLAHLVSGNVAGAIAALEAAKAGENPAIEANLSAAYLARAASTGDRQDLQNALDAADRALRHDGSTQAALFNRALALDRLGDARAPAAWQAALQAESDPGWRDEISRRLRR